MLCRVAESIYWMSRYVERAENVARFVDVNWNLALDLPGGDQDQQWLPLVTTTGDHELFYELYDTPSPDNVIHFLTFNRGNANSILSCIFAARENARSIREIISPEMWRQLNEFYLIVRDAEASEQWRQTPMEFFDAVRKAALLFAGITDATMTHGEGWHFGRMGRLLERADKTSRILDVKYFIILPSVDYVGSPFDSIQWAALLRSASAFEMYRQCYGAILPHRVVEFLIFDRRFPRAVHYCLCRADESLHAISGTPEGSYHNDAERQLGALRSELAFTTVDEASKRGLHEFIDDFQTKLNTCGNAVYEAFLAGDIHHVKRRTERAGASAGGAPRNMMQMQASGLVANG